VTGADRSGGRAAIGALAMAACVLVAPAARPGATDLPRATPAAERVDPVRLRAALDALGESGGVLAAVVVRGGRVVGERYWSGDAGTLRYVASVTKSFVSFLTGIAAGDGGVGGLDAFLADLLPPELLPLEPPKDRIRVRHLLTMTSGLDYDEDAEWLDWLAAPDQVRYVLDRPSRYPPGQVYSYSSVDPHLLAVGLAARYGGDLEPFAATKLFAPLGIARWAWERDRQGYCFGGHGLWLRTEDMARIGLLVLREGRWEGRTVVPRGWVRAATSVQVPLDASFGPLGRIGYGLLWWTDASLPHRVVLAWGWGGQFVLCVPDLDLVVATNARWDVPRWRAARQERRILEVIVTDLLPAVRERARAPSGRAGRAGPTVDARVGPRNEAPGRYPPPRW